ncbi:hypothetical protein C8A00DRAFT_33553 [Chaetomidium leptoderma]|uniref:Uncharacterized protein n=1 Tax=Chaetomidium leptoderma TaxID=669021 RepID=A0AAN6VM52_9PEZI|nr:hypothetical protein C8A00DRAFT_33553 [Chaetomidium leptoderma]
MGKKLGLALDILGKRANVSLKDRSTNSENPYKHLKTEEAKVVLASLSRNDADILRRVCHRAYRWDLGFAIFCCCGPRFGWSAIIGLLPVIGDFADLFMALILIKKAAKVDGGLPASMYARMMKNILLDFALGFIPVLGDFADMFYRANTRNAWLLYAFLEAKTTALHEGVIQDPDSGKKVSVPSELQVAPGDREGWDVEKGIEPRMVGPALMAPMIVPPLEGGRRKTPETGEVEDNDRFGVGML